MVQDPGALGIVAGPRTAASWRKTVRLKPGGYVFGGNVRTSEITTLPFGNRHGATLRVIGGSAQSKPLMGNNEPTQVECVFEVNEEREVTLGCELRASGGEARFEGLNLKIQQ